MTDLEERIKKAGMNARQISLRMGISPQTVGRHLKEEKREGVGRLIAEEIERIIAPGNRCESAVYVEILNLTSALVYLLTTLEASGYKSGAVEDAAGAVMRQLGRMLESLPPEQQAQAQRLVSVIPQLSQKEQQSDVQSFS